MAKYSFQCNDPRTVTFTGRVKSDKLELYQDPETGEYSAVVADGVDVFVGKTINVPKVGLFRVNYITGIQLIQDGDYHSFVFKLTYEHRNRTTTYLLPIVARHPSLQKAAGFYKVKNNLINAYCSFYEDATPTHLYLLYRYTSDKGFYELDEYLTADSSTEEVIKLDSMHYIYKIKVPKSYVKVVKLFMAGKYSEFPERYKQDILIFHSLSADSQIGHVLYKTEYYRKKLEDTLGCIIPEGTELSDVPNLVQEAPYKIKIEGICERLQLDDSISPKNRQQKDNIVPPLTS